MNYQLAILSLIALHAHPIAVHGQGDLAATARTVRPYSTVIRVNLTPTAAKSIRIESRETVTVKRLDDGKLLGQFDTLPETIIGLTDKAWTFGSREFDAEMLELTPSKSPGIWVDDHQYRGQIRLIRTSNSMITAVNIVDLEEYVASVVDGEMPLTFGEPARRAQAIVARTYALYQQELASKRSYDVFASTRSQKYLGFQYRSKGRRLAGESTSSRKIADETAGLVCTFGGELICTYYSAVCGGKTRLGTEVFSDAAEPLKPVECKWCEPSPLYRWNKSLEIDAASARVRSHAKSSEKPFGEIKTIQRSTRGNSPPLDIITFGDGEQTVDVAADVVRSNLFPRMLPSSLFVTRVNESTVEFAGAGHGHRVGLCQWGASGLGKAGATCLEILQHYYPGSKVVRLID